MIHGRNLIVSLDGVAIAGAKSCRLSISQEFLKACSPTASRVFDKIPTTYDWGVSADCLIPASTLSVSLTDKLIAGTKCLLTFTDGSGQNRAGWVYVKNCDESGSVGSLATFSASFESTGELYKYEELSVDEVVYGISGISVIGTTVTYNFASGATAVKGKSLSDITRVLIVMSTGPFVVYKLTFTNAKTAITNQDTNTLNDNTVACAANGTHIIELKKYTYHSMIRSGNATIKVLRCYK